MTNACCRPRSPSGVSPNPGDSEWDLCGDDAFTQVIMSKRAQHCAPSSHTTRVLLRGGNAETPCSDWCYAHRSQVEDILETGEAWSQSLPGFFRGSQAPLAP